MVKAKIDVDVSGVDRTIRKIKRDLHRGMEQSTDTLVDNARKEARRVISEERAIFNSEVYSGFRDAETKNTGSNVRVKLYNDVEHAEVLEEGATFPAKGPPVAALLPWVARKMQWGSSFDPDIYGGADYFDGGDDGDDGDGGPNGDSTDDYNPLFQKNQDNLSVGEEVYVQDSTTYRRLKVTKLEETEALFEDDGGARYAYPYDQVVSSLSDGPVKDRIDNFQKGDRIEYYDPDNDEYYEGVLTGEANYSTVTEYEVISSPESDTSFYVPQSEFVDWNLPPEVDGSKFTPEMEEVLVNSKEEALDEILYSNQDIALYNPITGETRSGVVEDSPWTDSTAVMSDGDLLYFDDDWEIRGAVKFGDLSKTEQKNTLRFHFDTQVNIFDDSSEDETWYKDQLINQIYENYSDDEKLAQTIFSWTELNVSTKRAHVSGNTSSGDDGWEMRMEPKPDPDNLAKVIYWKHTFAHEFGHGYSRPTAASTNTRKWDPVEYKFHDPWKDRKETEYNHMYEYGLPRWQFGKSDPVHGYKETYMFSEGDSANKISFNSSGDIQLDSRDSMNPYGKGEWIDEVQQIARADANGNSLAVRHMSTSTTELTEKQVFGKDDLSIDKGDYVTFEVDGTKTVYEYTGRDGSDTTFQDNPNDGSLPRDAEAISFESLEGDSLFLYRADGELYETETDDWDTSYLVKYDGFVGTTSVQNYDPSRDEMPELTQDTPTKRLQEAANMAWWYQANHIEADPSPGKERSLKIVLGDGYSATNAEEVMAMFTETLSNPDHTPSHLDNVEMVADKYPYFLKAYLKQRKPVSDDARKLLEDKGFL